MEKLILKRHALCICIAIMMLTCYNHVLYASDPRIRPRIIATTDGEIDDRQSMIRFLMYASDYDIAGIIEVNSKYQKSGHSGDKWIQAHIDKYGTLLPNLLKHNPNYPSVSYLKSVMRVGNENINDLNVNPDKMVTKNTKGEQLIIQVLLDSDPRPVHIGCWGGANTTASALWRLKYSGQYTKAQFDWAVAKVRIYCILYQDGGCAWIENNVKEAYIIKSLGLVGTWDYQNIDSRTKNPSNVIPYLTSTWLNANVKTGHGVLGAATPQKWVSEGDTPSFMNFVDNGLEAHNDYTLGGWGGRFARGTDSSKPNFVSDGNVSDDGVVMYKSYWRWLIDLQNDFQARMDWCIASSFSGANHRPNAQVVGSNVRTVAPGQTITLDATGTTDPDGNTLSYKWWQYYDADNAATKVSISNSTSKTNASFVVPNELGKQLHIILEVTDNGTPNLKGYQRIIFKIGSDGNNPPTVSLTAPTNNATFPAPATITINATAADTDGTVSKVDFFNGSTLLSSDESAPYSFEWSNVALGTYTITARATDNKGAVTISTARTVVVGDGGGCTQTPITPYVKVNDGRWVETSAATVNVGGSVIFGPHPTRGGSWSWSGPNGYSAAIKEITLSNVQTNQAGNYVATHINAAGCPSTHTFVVTVNGSARTIEENIITENNESVAYPNPSNGSFLIKIEGKFSYKINDRMGNIKETGLGKDECVVGTKLEAGIYQLRVHTQKGTMKIKIIKN